MRLDPRQSNPVGVVLILVTIAGLIGAVVMGRLVAQNDFIKVGAFFAGAAGIGLVLILGRNVWLLIPLCWPLTGKVQVLPLPLNIQEMAVAAAAGFYILLVVFKKPLHRPQTGWLELWLVMNLAWVATVYVRNPVGVRAFGTEMLGGRPYFEILVACFAFWVLTRTVIPAKSARLFPILMGAGSLFASGIGVLTTIFPRLTPFVAPFYSNIDVGAYQQEVLLGGRSSSDIGRMGTLKSFGTQMVAVLVSLFRPLGLFNPIKILPFTFFMAGIAAIFLSGFRSALIGTGVGFVIASYFWGGLQDAFRAVFLAFAAVLLLVSAQSAGLRLPLTAQRALTFLPGDWDPVVIRDARGTSEWRMDMWKTVLENPDKFLQNPILGSGFGYSQRDMEIQLSAYFGGQGYIGGSDYENQMITGAFHNGPLSAIRFVGIIGLILYYLLMIYMVMFAFRLVNRTRGSPYFYISIFLATPVIYGLFSYTFIIGAFDSALQQAIFACAMLRCTSESHSIWVMSRSESRPGVKSVSLTNSADLGDVENRDLHK